MCFIGIARVEVAARLRLDITYIHDYRAYYYFPAKHSCSTCRTQIRIRIQAAIVCACVARISRTSAQKVGHKIRIAYNHRSRSTTPKSSHFHSISTNIGDASVAALMHYVVLYKSQVHFAHFVWENFNMNTKYGSKVKRLLFLFHKITFLILTSKLQNFYKILYLVFFFNE